MFCVDLCFWPLARVAMAAKRTGSSSARDPLPPFGPAEKRTPISRPESRAISNLRKRIALILCNNAGHLHFYRLSPRPFSHSVGCELNRTRHPSGSSVPRCSTTALVACATPEKLWCQAVSKGLLAVPMAIAAMTTPVLQWLMAWAIQHSVFMQMAQRRRPNQSARFTPVRFPGSPPLAKPVIRNTGVHRRASGLAACGSRLAPACAPEP